MPEPIPRPWCTKVVEILRTSDPQAIEWTLRARQDWSFFGLEYEAYDALIATLSNPNLVGNPKDMRGAETSYEFYFLFDGRQLFAKLGLKTGHIRIMIFSLHRPLKDTL